MAQSCSVAIQENPEGLNNMVIGTKYHKQSVKFDSAFHRKVVCQAISVPPDLLAYHSFRFVFFFQMSLNNVSEAILYKYAVT